MGSVYISVEAIRLLRWIYNVGSVYQVRDAIVCGGKETPNLTDFEKSGLWYLSESVVMSHYQFMINGISLVYLEYPYTNRL